MRASSTCKVNSVHIVKIMMSNTVSVNQCDLFNNILIIRYISERWVQKRLDTSRNSDMIRFTYPFPGGADVPHPEQNTQAPVLAPARHTPSASARRYPRTVSRPRLFRSPGSRSGQVRDAARSTRRTKAHPTSGQELRVISSFVLSSPNGLPGIRAGRFASSAAGPRGGHKLTDEVMEFVTQTRAADPSLSLQQLARAVQERVRPDRASAQHRVGSCAHQKKLL